MSRNGKVFKIVQRPQLLNQKIIKNLESQQGFNRESLLKSIRNNKHNHLTATYYLLLKKHMIRQLKSYVDAFLEFKPIEEAREEERRERAEAVEATEKREALHQKFNSIDHTYI